MANSICRLYNEYTAGPTVTLFSWSVLTGSILSMLICYLLTIEICNLVEMHFLPSRVIEYLHNAKGAKVSENL